MELSLLAAPSEIYGLVGSFAWDSPTTGIRDLGVTMLGDTGPGNGEESTTSGMEELRLKWVVVEPLEKELTTSLARFVRPPH